MTKQDVLAVLRVGSYRTLDSALRALNVSGYPSTPDVIREFDSIIDDLASSGQILLKEHDLVGSRRSQFAAIADEGGKCLNPQ
jgi:hypothetical protein